MPNRPYKSFIQSPDKGKGRHRRFDGKLLAVAHADKVVGNARQIEQRHAAGKQQKLRKQIAGIERGNAVAVQQAESIDKAESKQGGGENDTPPTAG